MPLFRKKSESKSSDDLILSNEDEILAYLNEVFRKRIPLSITVKGKTISADILLLDQKNKAMRIQVGSIPPSLNGAEALCGFSIDRTWWAFKTKLAFQQDKPHLMVPKAIKHAERRKVPRTAFTAREQVKVTVMEGLGSGNGVFGMASDISPTGISVTIEKAMVLSGEREIPPSPTLFKPGAKLAFVKINRVPGAQMMETQGVAKRVWKDGSKWKCAIELDRLSKNDRAAIMRFIEPRVLDFKYVKRSMKREEELEARRSEIPAPSSGGSTRPTSSPVSSTASTRPSAASSSAAGSPAAAPAASADDDKARLLLVGSELLDDLPFLEDADNPYKLVIGNTPVGLIRILTEESPDIIICGSEFKGRSSIDILERINNMGMAGGRKIFICSQDLHGKDRIKYKMMKIDNFIELPVRDKAAFMTRLQSA